MYFPLDCKRKREKEVGEYNVVIVLETFEA
jgi:hypothetical protein